MSTSNEKPMLSSGGSGLTGPLRASNPIVQRMAEDMLRRAKAGEANEEHFRLGNYSFRQPDYNQILAWAKWLEIDPLKLLQILEDSSREPEEDEDWGAEDIIFSVEDGAIKSLLWDFSRLPALSDRWEQGLSLREFGTTGKSANGNLSLRGNQEMLHLLDCRQRPTPSRAKSRP